MNTAVPRYLDVRYAQTARPVTTVYPDRLAEHLTQSYLQGHRGGALLDLGCGRGEFLRAFENQGFEGHGADREIRPAFDFARPIRPVDLERGQLPFEDSSFEVVFNKSVLEHVTQVTSLLNECMRVLVPGGTLISLVPDFTAQWRHFYDDWTHVRPFTLVGLTECLKSHGFIIEESKRFRQLPALWAHPYLSPLADVSALLPNRFKTFKWVRFSKEWMLLAVAKKPRC